MKKQLVFEGVATALVTPMDSGGRIEKALFQELLEMQVQSGIDAVVVGGTTGESAVLSDEEQAELIRLAVRQVNDRIPVIAGAGSNNTAHAVALSRQAEELGADALLHVTPYYNKASQKGMLLHFEACAQACSIPILLYNVPSRTGVSLTPETCRKLGEIPNIAGIKEASGSISFAAEIAACCGDSLPLYAGNDEMATAILSLGGKGVVSVLSNIMPSEVKRLCGSFLQGDVSAAARMQLEYGELTRELFRDVNPIPIKQAMRYMGYPVWHCRLPLCDMEESAAMRLYAVLDRCGFHRRSAKFRD